MKLLVVGASGLVGGELCRRARAQGVDAIGVARRLRGEATAALDLSSRADLERVVDAVQPTHVALCAAYAHVDGCEVDPARSERENVATIRNVVQVLAGSKITALFFSTDHVFDGTKPFFVERDAVHPLSIYACHKRAAEELLLARGNALVVRTAWVFGAELAKKNFAYRVIAAARAGESLKLPRAQAGCPTWTGWLTASVLTLLDEKMTGIVHLTGDEPLTKAEWARLIAKSLVLPPLRIEEVSEREAGQVAPRPEQVVLRSERHALHQPPLSDILAGERATFLS